jgi:hypothetical protein
MDPSGLTTEVPEAATAGAAPQTAGSSIPGASAGTSAPEAAVLVPGVAVLPLGSGAVNLNAAGGSAGSAGDIVLDMPPVCVAVTELSGAVVGVVPSGRGPLTDTVPSG